MVLDTGMGGHLVFLVHISHPKGLDSCTTEPEHIFNEGPPAAAAAPETLSFYAFAPTCQNLQPVLQIIQLNPNRSVCQC